MSGVQVKICGLTTREAVITAQEGGADYIGFVFFPRSPRHLSPSHAAELAAIVPSLHSVAVLVSPSDDEIHNLLSAFPPTFLQLHGEETPERVAAIRSRFALPVIKALSIRTEQDLVQVTEYEKVSDMLLFDAKAPAGLPGGNGVSFDWTLLSGRHFAKPWFLSGGLSEANVSDALRITNAPLVDVSSGVESTPGVKDLRLIRNFITLAKST